MEKVFLEERECKNQLAGKKYKLYYIADDCVIADTEVGDVVVAFSQYEYYGMSQEELEKRIYDGIQSRTK